MDTTGSPVGRNGNWSTMRAMAKSRFASIFQSGLAVGTLAMVSACTHPLPYGAPVTERVLAEKALRAQLIERGAADPEFVHEILHQLGQGPEGDRRLARLLAEHLHHHPSSARALYHEVAQHRGFQDWVAERLRGSEEASK